VAEGNDQPNTTVITLTDDGNGDGTAMIDADASRATKAATSGASVSLGVGVIAFKPIADTSGSVRAYVGEGSKLTADDLSISADTVTDVTDPAMKGMIAEANVFSLGLAGLGGDHDVESLAKVTGEVEAFVGVQADQVSTPGAHPVLIISGTEAADGDVAVHADAEMKATADVTGLSLAGGVDISSTKPTAEVSGATRAYLRDGVDLTADTLLVEAGKPDSAADADSDPNSRVRYLARPPPSAWVSPVLAAWARSMPRPRWTASSRPTWARRWIRPCPAGTPDRSMCRTACASSPPPTWTRNPRWTKVISRLASTYRLSPLTPTWPAPRVPLSPGGRHLLAWD